MAKKLEACYYGDRKVIYLHIAPPSNYPQKHLSVYGHPFTRVIQVVDEALKKAFGKTGAGRPPGRRKKKK
jgi:hypothetical protein